MSGPQIITHTGILLCSIISDDDGIYACVDVRVSRYQPRYKYIRNIKIFNEKSFLEDFSTLPPSVTDNPDDHNDQSQTLNHLFREYLERHARLKKVRITRPPDPWIKCRLIQDLQHPFMPIKDHFMSIKSWFDDYLIVSLRRLIILFYLFKLEFRVSI